jgi:mRNA-degrading endonuclease RelE of RelBE toxin-antitoxin system
MSWTCRLARQAAKQFRRLPQDRRKQIAQAIEEMGRDPTSGGVRPVKSGKFKGTLRKRVGRYRTVFTLSRETQTVDIAAIIVRTGKTYR